MSGNGKPEYRVEPALSHSFSEVGGSEINSKAALSGAGANSKQLKRS